MGIGGFYAEDGLGDFHAAEAVGDHMPGSSVAFPVVERFVSLNGEGLCAGRPAAFIRFRGCNLDCSYCDTRWANDSDARAQKLRLWDVVDWVRDTGLSCVTLTGGEPLLQAGLQELVLALLRVGSPKPLRVEVETNGSVSVQDLRAARITACQEQLSGRLVLTIDCKTPSSGNPMDDDMMQQNFRSFEEGDSVKFVVGSREDLEFMERVAGKWRLWDRCAVLVSPVWGKIEPAEIAEFLVDRKLDRARLQLQLHKIIWPGVEKGV